MVAGINGASNSKANKKKTTNVAWSPAPPKKDKADTPSVGLLMLKRKNTNYRAGGGEKSFEDWRKTK